jgi:multidrug efflux pump subunit AcrA (membrane-fusion protein)
MMPKRWILINLILMAVLVGCSSSTPDPASVTPIITAAPITSTSNTLSSGGSVVASGVIVPKRQANLGLVLPARIQSVDVVEGEAVEEGQILVQLAGREQMEAVVAAAEYNLLIAQQAAESVDEVTAVTLAQAKLDLANAWDALDDAERQWTVNQLGNRATPSALKDAKADVIISRKRLIQARNMLDNASGTSSKAQTQIAVTNAERVYYQAVWLVNWLQSEPTELEQAFLDAELDLAKALFNNVEREVEHLEDGSNPDAIALAEANLKIAETQLAAARSALADSKIRAPFAGTVTTIMVSSGEAVAPGQVLLTMADFGHLQAETTDLSERDVDQVKVGQTALIYLEALGEKIEGEVASISQQATMMGGDVVYKVIIDLATHPPDLLWGMSVEVEISTD